MSLQIQGFRIVVKIKAKIQDTNIDIETKRSPGVKVPCCTKRTSPLFIFSTKVWSCKQEFKGTDVALDGRID